MQKMKLILFILILMVVLFGCKEYNTKGFAEEEAKIAEEFVINYYIKRTACMYVVENTTYDTKKDRYKIYLSCNENGDTKTATVKIENSQVSMVDFDDGKGENPVRYVAPNTTEIPPNNTIIEFK